MTIGQRLTQLFYLHLSRPAGDRPLWRWIGQRRVQRVLQIGVGTCELAERLLKVASLHCAADQLRLTGIDLFEARGEEQRPGLPLKEAHRRLKSTGATIQLAPGDPHSALARVANALPGTQLVMIAADTDPEALERAWFYLPRVLAAESRVFVERLSVEGQVPVRTWEILTPADVAQRATTGRTRRAA